MSALNLAFFSSGLSLLVATAVDGGLVLGEQHVPVAERATRLLVLLRHQLVEALGGLVLVLDLDGHHHGRLVLAVRRRQHGHAGAFAEPRLDVLLVVHVGEVVTGVLLDRLEQLLPKVVF